MFAPRLVLAGLVLTLVSGGHNTPETPHSNSRADSAPVAGTGSAGLSAEATRSIIVRFEPAAAGLGLPAPTQDGLAAMGAEITQTLCDGRISIVRLGPDVDVQTALARIRTLPQVRYAVANDAVTLSAFVPNDPQFSSQWALRSSLDMDIRATLAWDQTVGSSATLVAVMDTGIDYRHPDLYLAIPVNYGEIPSALRSQLVDTNVDGRIDFEDLNSLDAAGNVVLNGSGTRFNSTLATDRNGNGYIDAGDILVAPWIDGVDNDGNGRIDDLVGWNLLDRNNNPLDTNGHGTHVAGIIGARGNNAVGVAGVNWRARLLPLRFHSGGGGHATEAIQAIDYAVSRGVKIINSSWGITQNNQALYDAIEWAGENGVVVVAAAGNAGSNLDTGPATYYPAQYSLPNLISVGSLQSNGTYAADSNYGVASISIAAPGVHILSTAPGGGYVHMSGTSMATPHVAGVVSLLAGLFPAQSPIWLVDRVLSSARPLPSLSDKVATGGMVDAYATINTQNAAGPRIVSATPQGDVAAAVDRVAVTFDRPIAAATFGVTDVTVTGPSGGITPTAIVALSTLAFEVRFATQTALGTYTVRVGPSIADMLGRLMDQDRDGLAGEPQDDRFELTFREVPPPQIQIIDDGETGFSTTTGWVGYLGAGARGDLSYKQAGSGSGKARWAFTDLAPGQYRVAATWAPYSNRPIDATYGIIDGTALLATVPVNQQAAPSGFVEQGIAWQNLGGPYMVTGDSLLVELSDQVTPAGSYVIADAVRIERIGPLPPGPELQILVDGISVADGSTFNFGRVAIGSQAVRAITARNLGTTDLALGPLSAPAGFTVSGFSPLTLVPGQSTSFSIAMNTGAEGLVTGSLGLESDDEDENPFDLVLTGIVSMYPAPFVIDDGDPNFYMTAGWTSYSGAGAQQDLLYKQGGAGGSLARWSFPDLAPGKYRVAATWVAYSNRPLVATYTVHDGATTLAAVPINQQQPPASFIENGIAWQDLGATFTVTGEGLFVELNDLVTPGSSYLIADAVRVERIGALAPEPEIQVLANGVSLADGSGTLDFGRVLLGTSVSKTITVRNLGAADLTLGSLSLPAGFTLASDFGTTTVAPGQATTFVVRLDGAAEGTVTGGLSFASNDADESPFNIGLTGTVSMYPAPFVVDDGDVAYTATGGWSSYNGVGAQGDFSYKAAGSGLAAATWTFSGLAPGQYRVSVTWEPYSNRPLNAPFTVFNGTIALGTIPVNQQVVPGSFLENGVHWQDLGSFTLAGDTLVVQLRDSATPGSYVIADAVRVERIGN